MKSVRQKWASHKTFRKIQKSWQDYATAAEKSDDVQIIAQRLNAFLDTFTEAYQEMITQVELEHVEPTIDRVYGDCSEILVNLFNAIEREAVLKKSDRVQCMQEAMNKALVLINLILKDEKYRRLVAEASDYISRLLSLLEKPGTGESKILLLRIIATIGESDRNKIEIAKLEGYKKILRLLINEGPELTQEVVRTVNHLLEFNDDHPDMLDLGLVVPGLTSSVSSPLLPTFKSGTKPLLSRSSIQLTRPQSPQSSLPPRPKSFIMDRHPSRSGGVSPFDSPRRQNSSTSLKNLTSIDRVSHAISEVRGIFVQELGKIFPQLKDQDGLGILGMGSDDAGISRTEQYFIPNIEQVQFAIAYYSQLLGHDKDAAEPGTEPETDNSPPPVTLDLTLKHVSKASRKSSLKKMASTPDLHAATKPKPAARRNSEDKLLTEISKATRGAAVELAQEEELLRKSQPDNVLKEFMRTQGALRSLMSILKDNSAPSKRSPKPSFSTGTRLATKIDIMETICKVLFQNSANQLEFRAMDGYSTLLKVFDEIVVPTGSGQPSESPSGSPAAPPKTLEGLTLSSEVAHEHPSHTTAQARTNGTTASKRSLLLGSLSAVFFDLALDGSSRDMVQNTDAYHFLFRLLLESKHLDIRQQALYTIQDLISLNALNAVAAWRCGEVDLIIGLLRISLSPRSSRNTLLDGQWEIARMIGLDTQSPNIRGVVFPMQSYFGGFVVSEETGAVADLIEQGSPVYQYLIGLTRLLEYMAVMLIQDNVYILYELSRLLMEVVFPDDASIVTNIVLRCVARVVSDMVARGVSIEEKFSSIYLQIIRRILDRQGETAVSSSSAKTVEDEKEQEIKDSIHTEQRLLTLQILGMILRGTGNGVDVFELLQGLETLTSTILVEKRACHHLGSSRARSYAESLADPNLCQDCFRSDIVVSDLALWLFREVALQDSDNAAIVTWIITMLKSTLSGIETLRRQSDAAKMTKYSQSFLHVPPEAQEDQAHTLLVYLYAKICGTVSLLFRNCSDSKVAFGEAGGMQILLSILSTSQHQDIATAALVAVGDFFAGYEGTKTLLGDDFGYDGFLEIVLDSCRPLDKVCCEIVLEVATVGNVMSSKTRPHVESDTSIYCSEVWPYIGALSEPRVLFDAALPFSCPRKIGNRNSFRSAGAPITSNHSDRHATSSVYQTNGRGTPSRPSSVYLEDNAILSADVNASLSISGTPTLHLPAASVSPSVTSSANSNRYSMFGMPSWAQSITPTLSISTSHDSSEDTHGVTSIEPAGPGLSRRNSLQLHQSGRSTPAPAGLDGQDVEGSFMASIPLGGRAASKENSKGIVTNRKRSNSRNLGGFGLNTTHLGFHSVIPPERIAFKQLAGIVFRDADAARMTLRLLGRIIECNNPKLATEYFNLLMLLMEVTPRNKELLGRNDGLRFMLKILFRRGRQQDGLAVNSGYSVIPRISDPPYVDLVPALGAYDISAEDVRLLFDAVNDPVDMFLRLSAESPRPSAFSNSIRDSLGALPDLPTTFDHDFSKKPFAGRPRSESASASTPHSNKRGGGRHQRPSLTSAGGFQFSPLFVGEMEQQMMYAIEKISERIDPPAYFNFNGLDASLTTPPGTVEKAVSAKGGYTVSFWIKVTAFLERETGLFCYEEESGNRTIFELYFKSLDQSNRYCLCVRTQHYPSPPEDFVFDRFDFAVTGIWHHIVFVHHKTMKLMVDGCVIQSYGTFNQRRQDRDGTMVGVLGRKGRNSMPSVIVSPRVNDGMWPPSSTPPVPSRMPLDQCTRQTSFAPTLSAALQQELSLGYFCGQAGKVHFLQGEWDQATAEKVYNLGPASTESWKSLDIKSGVITILDPEEFKEHLEGSQVTGLQDKQASDTLSKARGLLQGGCTIHMTQAMRDLMSQVEGIQLCFQFLEMSPVHLQLVGLRVISNLLYKSPVNIAQFQNELDGYETMFTLLYRTAADLTTDHFGVLFDIAINGIVKDEHLILSNMPCVQLILRLLPSTADAVQSYILRTLVDLIVESPENMRLWRASFGMPTLFQLLRTLPAHLRPFLMWTLESMMDGMTVQELGLLIGFIGHENSELFEVRRDIIEMIFKRMTMDHGLVDLLGSGLEGVTVLIGLLDSPNEHFRILVLKMIGILLSDNIKSGKASLDKPNTGITLIRTTLEKYPLSMDVIQVLLGLAQNSFRCDPVYRSASASMEKGTAASSKRSMEKPASVQKSGHSLAGSNSGQSPTEIQLPGLQKTLKDAAGPLLQTMTPTVLGGPAEDSMSKSRLSSKQTTSTPRQHVHSNSANAPFIKMSTLPVESLTSVEWGPVPAAGNAAVSGGAKVTDELAYASMIRLVLELIGSLSHTDLVTHTLTDLKRLMTAENMRILWDAGWVNWIGAFMLDKSKVRMTTAAENLSYNRTMGVLDGMMQKMMIFDLSRKGSVTVRNKGSLVRRDEDVGVQLRLTEAALAWFDKNPNLDTDAANVICKGLVILFRRLEELSRRFEEKQRVEELARQSALDAKRLDQERRRAEEQERERLALEAVSSALNGVLDTMGELGQCDDFETKSVLFKADDGDTDAEELAVERHDEDSSASDIVDAMETRAVISGSSSPTCSNSSTLSLPLSTFSAAMAATESPRGQTKDSFESQGHGRNHNGAFGDSQAAVRPSRSRPNRRYQNIHRRAVPNSGSNSSTPPALPDHTGVVLIHSHEMGASHGGIFWPPLALYDHFASCINNLACYNNSVIRAAMKSSGLFKIRDGLVEKLGQVGEGGQGQGYPSYMSHSYMQPPNHSPAMSSSSQFQQSSLYHPHSSFGSQSPSVPPSGSSSSSSTHHESDTHYAQHLPPPPLGVKNGAKNEPPGMGRKRPSSQQRHSRSGGSGLGLTMSSFL